MTVEKFYDSTTSGTMSAPSDPFPLEIQSLGGVENLQAALIRVNDNEKSSTFKLTWNYTGSAKIASGGELQTRVAMTTDEFLGECNGSTSTPAWGAHNIQLGDPTATEVEVTLQWKDAKWRVAIQRSSSLERRGALAGECIFIDSVDPAKPVYPRWDDAYTEALCDAWWANPDNRAHYREVLDARPYTRNQDKTECMYVDDDQLCPWYIFNGGPQPDTDSHFDEVFYVTQVNGESYLHKPCRVNNWVSPCGWYRRGNTDCTMDIDD